MILMTSCGLISGFQRPSTPVLSYPPDYAPQVLVLYEPYPIVSHWLRGVVPIPSYQGWPDERMARDLRRLREVGVTGLILCVPPESIADSYIVERITRFYDFAAEQESPITIGLAIVPTQKMAISRMNVVSYLRRNGLMDAKVVLRLEGRPFLGFSEDITLTDLPNNEVSIRQWGNEWHVRPRTGAYDQIAVRDSVIWVCAGFSGDCHKATRKAMAAWPQPRDKTGETFRLGLRQAFAAGAEIVCIDSWNDFSAGSFIEPNSYDQDLLYRVLKEELTELALRRRSSATN